MDFNKNDGIPVVRLRVFKAVEDQETSQKFYEGHQQILTNIGVNKVTSSTPDWITNPYVYVFIVESLDKTKLYGGARIHINDADGNLPMVNAIKDYDPKIIEYLKSFPPNSVAEGCGLWNSREIAGYGIGSIFLSRTAVAIAHLLNIKHMLALCAPYTVKLCESIGYEIEVSLGNNGTFNYPKEDLLATTMILKDVANVPLAEPDNRDAIFQLRNVQKIVRKENLRNKEIEIEYVFDNIF
jgi:hypothetical protein